MRFINLTPHAIKLNDGTVFEPSGTIARVSTNHSEFDADGICRIVFGDVQNLPSPQEGVVYITSGMVAAAVIKDRHDVVSPATGHPECVRDENGRIVSVPGFVKC